MRRNTQTRLQKLALAKCQTNRDLSFNAAYEEVKESHAAEMIFITDANVQTLKVAIHGWEQNKVYAQELNPDATVSSEANSHFLEELFRISDGLKRRLKKIEKLENEPED